MAGNARFHNKYHRRNHHTLPSADYPDSGADPIASSTSPFLGDFYLAGSLSAANNINVAGNMVIQGSLSALGDTSFLNTIITTSSALSVVNAGTGPALTVNQIGAQPVALFLDDSKTAFKIDNGYTAAFFDPSLAGILTVTGILSVQNLSSSPTFNVSPITMNATASGSVFATLQNFSNGVSASTDISVYNDTSSFLDMGIASSTYNGNNYYPAFNVVGSGDSYIFTNANDLAIGTSSAGAGNDIILFTGGTLSGTFATTPAGNERMRITSTGNIGMNVSNPGEKLTILGNISASGNLFVDSASSRNITVVHTPINDGVPPLIRIGESDFTSPNAGFSGFHIAYNEVTNVLGVSSVFAATNAFPEALNINRTGNVTFPSGISTTRPVLITSNYNLSATDTSIICNGSGTISLVLQSAASYPGRIIYVKTIAAQLVQSATSNIIPIDTNTPGSAILTNVAGKWAMLQSDGTYWVAMMAN